MPKRLKFRVKSTQAPIVSIDTVADSAYVYFQRGVKVARTQIINEWPHVAVDFDENGGVVGIEAVSPGDLSIQRVAESASVSVPKRLIQETQYKSVQHLATV